MKISKKTVMSAFLSFFMMCAAVTGAAADDTATGKAVNDASATVVYPSQQNSQSEEKADDVLKRSSSLSYGMDIIRHSKKLIKTSTGEDVEFSLSDFAGFSDGESVYSVTIANIPSSSSGTLKLGALDAYPGQKISAALAGKLRFIPSNGTAKSEFEFSVNGSDEKSVCVIYTLKKENSAPAAESARAYTKTNVPLYSKISASDPDGDELSYNVIRQPSHGIIKVESDGAYVYTPAKNYSGKDSFVITVSDKYGKESEYATVAISVEKHENDVVYSDVGNSKYEYAALLLSEKGILTGESVGGTMRFEPDKAVSRADFIVMAMAAAGYAPNVLVSYNTGFEDEQLLTASQKGYVITAVSAGVISAEDGEGKLEPASWVTYGEAAEIMSALGINAGAVSDPDLPITRGDAAIMLAALADSRR